MAKRKTHSRSAPAKRRTGGRSKHSSGPSLNTWVFAIVLIVGLIAGVSYLNQSSQKGKTAHSWVEAFHALKAPSTPTKTKVAPKSKPKPEFEFYTALPEGGLQPTKAPVAKSTTASNPATVTPPKATSTKTPSTATITNKTVVTPAATASPPVNNKHIPAQATRYFLQVASFTQYDDANHLRARLLLEAYNANIQKTSVNGKDWYRVVVGPYKDATTLNQAQSNLATLQYKTILLQAK
jgi:cell division septation protein DedD